MSQIEFELITLEQQQELREACEIAVKVVNELYDVIFDFVQSVMDIVVEFAINLARFFLKMQLLEWKIPYRLADFVARNTPWHWAWRFGFNWFVRKYALKE